jgi:hypothetical protein
MLKYIVLILLLAIGFSKTLIAQDVSHVWTLKYNGYIFPNNDDYFIPNAQNKTRWKPTKIDIKIIEKLIRETYKTSWNELIKLKKLSKYRRQYFGYINNKGERIIWVNYICGCQYRKELKSNSIVVFDGGNCYWNVRVNIDTMEVFDFSVNGVS